MTIIVLLAIVYFSYRQTIQAYPGGGGSYTVARQNLGVSAGLLAAAALMIDYVLVVAVGSESGLLFTAPTYLFVGCLLLAVALGVVKTLKVGLKQPPMTHGALPTCNPSITPEVVTLTGVASSKAGQ